MRRVAAVAAVAVLALPGAAFAQAAAPAPVTASTGTHASAGHATHPNPPAPAPRRNGSPYANHGSTTAAVIVNANGFIPAPNPQRTPFHNTTHAAIPPGEDAFGSLSTGK